MRVVVDTVGRRVGWELGSQIYSQGMHGGRVVCNKRVFPQRMILTAKGTPTTCPDSPAALVTLLAKSSAIRTWNGLDGSGWGCAHGVRPCCVWVVIIVSLCLYLYKYVSLSLENGRFP